MTMEDILKHIDEIIAPNAMTQAEALEFLDSLSDEIDLRKVCLQEESSNGDDEAE